MHIEILRLGHRLPRDERISTHVALVARAFGASAIAYTGQHDSGLEDSVNRICENWGAKTPQDGRFSISYERSAVAFIKACKRDGCAIIHLTMYGMPVMEKLHDMAAKERILVIVGSEQVPAEIYQLADFNISVTNQPHSEVAALAIVLDRLMEGQELDGLDLDGRISVSPSERGKVVNERKAKGARQPPSDKI
jgi:tRNA (cytidine56-2'-O)-methyltransferase